MSIVLQVLLLLVMVSTRDNSYTFEKHYRNYFLLIGSPGNSSTQLSSCRGIAFDSNTNTFYITDTNNNRVMSYTLNSTVGTLVAGGNGAGNSSTQLNAPRGLYFDASTNSLVIANYGANNIVRWVLGALNWTLVAGNLNAVAGSGPMEFDGPYDVTLDPMGNVYVADRNNDRIQFFQAGQSNGSTIAGVTNSPGTGPTQLNGPLSVALDSQLNLYVSDTQNNRIQKFSRYN
jgi:sugar lactone lactonase YvrE